MKSAFSKCSIVSVVIAVLAFSLPAFASPVVKHEKIVAADGSGDFTTISAALNFISDASAANPYLITVKPGIYNEIVNMKQYVDIKGSGQENTKITSGSVGSAGGTCGFKGTVVMESNTRLENIEVENTNTGFCRMAVNITGKTNVIIDRVNAQLNGNFASADNDDAAAIYIIDSTAPVGTVNIKNTTAIGSGTLTATGAGFNSYGIYMFSTGGPVYVDNVSALCTSQDVWWCVGMAAFAGTAYISNSSFIALGGTNAYGIAITSTNIRISNASIAATSGSSQSYGIQYWDGTAEINNSRISGINFGINGGGGGSNSIKIGSSLISSPSGTPLNGLTSGVDKVVNCYDGNYNPIPNF